MTTRQYWLLIAIILLSVWLQACLSNRISVLHGKPDFVLTTIVCIAVLTGTTNSVLLCVWGGFLTAVLAGFNYGSILISRLVTGAVAGLLRQHVIQDSIVVPPLTVFLATWICEGLYFLMAPNLHGVHWWLRMVLSESFYNSVLAVPIYFGLRLIRFGTNLEGAYNPFAENV
jgi:rod shape-determining protein MreD